MRHLSAVESGRNSAFSQTREMEICKQQMRLRYASSKARRDMQVAKRDGNAPHTRDLNILMRHPPAISIYGYEGGIQI